MKIISARNRRAINLEVIDFVDLNRTPRGQVMGLGVHEASSSPTVLDQAARDFPELSVKEIDALMRANVGLTRYSDPVAPHVGASEEVLVRENGELKILSRRLTVRFRADLTENKCLEVLAAVGANAPRALGFAPNLYVIDLPKDKVFGQIEDKLESEYTSMIEYVEPVMSARMQSNITNVGATAYETQWQWPAVAAEGAWQNATGQGVTVAVIDRGFNARVPHLAPGVDTVLSAKIQKDTTVHPGMSRIPKYAHGTFCAAQVGGRASSDTDVRGIAPGCTLMLVTTPFRGETFMPQLYLALAVSYAASPRSLDPGLPAEGAQVVTCSEGPVSGKGELDRVLEDAFNFAARREVPVFWAVANANRLIADDKMAAHPSLIRVGSSNALDDPADQCAFGPELDFLAPGDGVYNVYHRKPKHQFGTSFATPVAAGIAALMLEQNPGLGAEDIRRLMRESCRRVGPVLENPPRHDRFGHGIVNAEGAVRAAISARMQNVG